MVGRASALLLAASISVALVSACDDGAAAVRAPAELAAEDEVVVAADDRVVATVDDVPITASRVARLVEATGRAPRDVVEHLIDFELLAAEARRRGLEQSRDVAYVERQEMVQRYLEEEFEPTHGPADVPDSFLRAAYREKLNYFVHPRLCKVAHILVLAEAKKARPAERAAARELAEEIRREAVKASDVTEFLNIGKSYQGRGGFTIKAEKVSTVVYEHAALVRPFIEAALRLQSPGEVSDVVQTEFGSHIIYLMECRPPSDRSFEEAREEVLEKAFPFWRKLAFHQLTEKLRRETKIVGFSGPKRRAAQQ